VRRGSRAALLGTIGTILLHLRLLRINIHRAPLVISRRRHGRESTA
jgi:hypothetical protein